MLMSARVVAQLRVASLARVLLSFRFGGFMRATRPSLQFDALLYRDGSQWAAHCLQLDLVEVQGSAEAALADLLDVIRAHVEWAIEHDNMGYLFQPAPPEVWKMFLTARRTGTRTIRLRPSDGLKAPLPRVTVQEAAAEPLAA